MKYYVFYHNADHDGFASWYLIQKYLKIKYWHNNEELHLPKRAFKDAVAAILSPEDQTFLPAVRTTDVVPIPYNYGDNILRYFNKMLPEDVVIFADCLAYQNSDLINAIRIAEILEKGHLYVYDHHISVIDWLNDETNRARLDDRKAHIYTTTDNGKSAVLLIHQTLFRDPAPRWVKLISYYDTWYKENMNWAATFSFQQWLRYGKMINKSTGEVISWDYLKPETALSFYYILDNMDDKDYEWAIETGELITNTLEARNLLVWKKTGFVANVFIPEILVTPTLAAFCSDELQSSAIFDQAIAAGLLRNDVNLCINLRYNFKNQQLGDKGEVCGYESSIYSRNPELYPADKIAKALNGGGHAGAAGTPPGNPKHIKIRKIIGSSSDDGVCYNAIITNSPHWKRYWNEIFGQ
jgi:hypothetical protein